MLVQAALVTDKGGCNLTRITKHTTKEINYYSVSHKDHEYRIMETRTGSWVDYEITRELGNAERVEILTILRTARELEKKDNERKRSKVNVG
jgi:hypothetical protein